MRERERTRSMHFSHEFLKQQSQRLSALNLLSDEELLELRKKKASVTTSVSPKEGHQPTVASNANDTKVPFR